jgi:hypothetical protein
VLSTQAAFSFSTAAASNLYVALNGATQSSKATDLIKKGTHAMGIFSDLVNDLTGGTSSHHSDGSTTHHYSSGSITTETNGIIREATSQTTTHPLGIGEKITVTKDGDGNVINVQRGW